MDWTRQLDAYCERLGPGIFAEPANALTNAAFVAVALWLLPRSEGMERVLATLLLLIGVGSGLFHTAATAWAALADTAAIAGFVLVYVYAANRRVLGLGRAVAVAGALAVVPYAALLGFLFAQLPGFAVSAIYWPIPLLIALYALGLHHRRPAVARGFAIGACVLTLSLILRSIDSAVCEVFPVGTHFAWHLLNAIMLGWMITVLRRHRLEPVRAGR